jgi:predicted RNase H-like nuclease (RuvC/YqgF family)
MPEPTIEELQEEISALKKEIERLEQEKRNAEGRIQLVVDRNLEWQKVVKENNELKKRIAELEGGNS